MVRKLLALIFNRFVLVGLLLLGLLAVIWWFGPLIAIGESRPLDSDRSRWITSAALILAVVSIFAWSAWRSRRGNAEVVAPTQRSPVGSLPLSVALVSDHRSSGIGQDHRAAQCGVALSVVVADGRERRPRRRRHARLRMVV